MGEGSSLPREPGLPNKAGAKKAGVSVDAGCSEHFDVHRRDASAGERHTGQTASLGDADKAALAELQRSLELLQRVTERKAARLGARTRSTIRAYPWPAIGLAGLAGAAVALAVLPSSRGSTRHRRHVLERMRDVDWPSFSIPTISLNAPEIPSRRSLVNYAEQAADAISRMDPQAFSSERLAGLSDALRSAMKALGINR